jgi:hypothetical protein
MLRHFIEVGLCHIAGEVTTIAARSKQRGFLVEKPQ